MTKAVLVALVASLAGFAFCVHRERWMAMSLFGLLSGALLVAYGVMAPSLVAVMAGSATWGACIVILAWEWKSA